MKVDGHVLPNTQRNKQIIQMYYGRLIGLLGFRPFVGMLNVRLERRVSLKHSPKAIENILLDGTRKIDAYLAPARLRVKSAFLLSEINVDGCTIIVYKWKGRDAFALRKNNRFVTWDIIRGGDDRKIIGMLVASQERNGLDGKLLGRLLASQGRSGLDRKLIGRLTTSKLHGETEDCWAVQFTNEFYEANVVGIISEHPIVGIGEGSSVEIELL
jgi:hypothetical protein